MSVLTTVNLCRVDLNSRYEHSIHFDDEDKQHIFFENRVIKRSNNYTHIRRTWELQVEFPYSEIKECNYLWFAQDKKDWYYFINGMEYKNEGSTTLSLELDVIQTYMFDWQIPPCFIERQHTETDELYEHTIDEALECGELQTVSYGSLFQASELALLVFATINPESTTKDTTVYSLRSKWDNMFSGVSIYAVEPDNFSAWSQKLESLSSWGKIDGIVSMHMYPKDLIRLDPQYSWGDGVVCKSVAGANTKDVKIASEFNMPGQELRTYTPKNKKLYCYPYTLLYISNNTGGSAVYKCERFNYTDNGSFMFQILGGLTPDSGCKIIPYYYNTTDSGYMYEEGLTLTGYPSCAYDSDTYKIWLAQNQNQHALTISDANVKKAVSVIGGIGGAIGGIATGNYGAAVGSLSGGAMGYYQSSMQIKSLVAQQNDMSITPPQARGSFSPSLNTANGLQVFTVYYKTLTDENAKIIDDYFTMYGYKINRLRIPNTNARQKFTYVKTVGCLVRGDFNQLDKQKIQSIFDNGITFWRDGLNIGSYGDNPCW